MFDTLVRLSCAVIVIAAFAMLALFVAHTGDLVAAQFNPMHPK